MSSLAPNSSTPLTLYFSPGSCALASRIALNEAQADYTLVTLSFANEQQRSAEYLALNPHGRVPALATEDGVVTESPAVLAYIAQRFPEANLAPTDAFGFAKLQAFNSYLSSTVHVAHAHNRRGSRWADLPESHADMRAKVGPNMAAAFQLIEDHYLQGPWVLGEQYTVADAYLFTMSKWLATDGVDINLFPRVAEHFRRMGERPAVQATLA